MVKILAVVVLILVIWVLALNSVKNTGSKNLPESAPPSEPLESTASSRLEQSPATPAAAIKTYNSPPPMQINSSKSYTAILNTTAGQIQIQLDASVTPITVNNFVFLARHNFYDDTIFHRVIKGFMIQGGDPKGDGTGGPGYTFADEPFSGEYSRGTVAMANAGPNTNGSQFFIMQENANLPKNYVIFGKVTKGLDVVDRIAEAAVKESPAGEMSSPAEPVKITSVFIEEN
ncbi:MAG: peptidylprolyl isomerase [Patescibacteria group bacterium]|nr:peptidylprolyl isomerase [Patescibacteria group bacterium]